MCTGPPFLVEGHTLQSRYLSNFDTARKKAGIVASYEAYFKLVEEKIQQYSV